MAIIDFIYRTNKSKTTIGLLRLDLLVSEELTLTGGATKYPVETGSEISDHIKEGSISLRISGEIVAAEGWLGRDTKLSMIDALEALKSMHKAREQITVITGLTRYPDLAIESLSAVRANSTEGGGNWLKISGEFTQIRKVSSKTAEIEEQRTTAPTRGRAGSTRTNTQNATTSSQSGAATATGGAENGGLAIRALDRVQGAPLTDASQLLPAASRIPQAAAGGVLRAFGVGG